MVFLWFLDGDEGAVTVDWVVLTAALVGFGIGTTAAVRGGV
ncbi:MAG TPA: pilus assembly protein, partial [Arcobacter sp.]|nr:pilus assembly protein [Arcobacter sp.]